ncbi:MAG: DUF4936 family protein [Betaproteobacteria bacterium]|nr:DUF4936 family protein [Betaproteobacteria bacterium]
MKSAYVYYRIDPAQTQLAAGRVDALLSSMAGYCSERPRRLSRCDDTETWMEIYEGISDFTTFTAALHSAAQDIDCATFTRGDRHLECFYESGPTP